VKAGDGKFSKRVEIITPWMKAGDGQFAKHALKSLRHGNNFKLNNKGK
jgi:hypothetical protein